MSGASSLVVRAESAADTFAVGLAFGRSLLGAQTLSVAGPLGAGKTVLIQGVCEGLGVRGPVTSPTYTLMHEYEGRGGRRVVHLDCFRLSGPVEFEELDAFATDEESVVLVEWGDRVDAALPPDAIRVRVEPEGEFVRRISIDVPDGVELDLAGSS
jgi:tRNA threonylcarbamoyladenosine biosynthesis protein TsaE